MTSHHTTKSSSSLYSRETKIKSQPVSFLDLVVFLLPTCLVLEVSIVGRLMGFEIVALVVFPFLFWARGHRLWQGWTKVFLILLGVWLVSQVCTDVIRGTPFVDYARGWARIGMTFVTFSVLFFLVYDAKQPEKRIKLLVTGLIVGTFLDFIVSPERGPGFVLSADLISLWKYGFGHPVTLSVVLASAICYYRGRRSLGFIMLLAIGVVDILLWKRSLGGVCILTSLILWGKDHFSVFTFSIRNISRLVAIGLIILLFGYGILNGYEYAARQGLLGQTNKRLIIQQGGGPGGVLLGGRVGILASLLAIRQSPIIGYGSWAEAPRWLYIGWLQLAIEAGHYDSVRFQIRGAQREGKYILPSHSILFGSWVHAGLGAVPVWICVLWLAMKVITEIRVRQTPMALLAVYLSITLAWNILFSPFGNMQRLVIPYAIVIALTALKLTPQTIKNNARHN